MPVVPAGRGRCCCSGSRGLGRAGRAAAAGHGAAAGWGAAAAALQQLPVPGAADEQQAEQQRQQRVHVLRQRLQLDPARAALTVCHWPEACSLAAPGSSAAATPASSSSSDAQQGGALAQLPAAAAAYDPGFLLPFCCACLAQQLLAPRAFAEAGLLSGARLGIEYHCKGLLTAFCAPF